MTQPKTPYDDVPFPTDILTAKAMLNMQGGYLRALSDMDAPVRALVAAARDVYTGESAAASSLVEAMELLLDAALAAVEALFREPSEVKHG